MNLPAKLKSSYAAQIDTVLTELDVKQHIGISLIYYEIYDHIPTKAVFDALYQIEDIVVDVKSVEETLWEQNNLIEYLSVSNNGDVLVLRPLDNNSAIQLSIYEKPNHLHANEESTISQLISDYDIAAIITIRKLEKTTMPIAPPVNKSSAEGEAATQTHYATSHFTRHMRTISSIIGISIVLALLGVITPLGFQTFTDKILPYQAQSSLMTVAILLVVAALVTALFSYFHDYQESVLFAKYQSGLGKDVFTRLLAMEIPYFDSRNVGDLTKLVDQVEEASNFLVKQLLGSIVALISLLVVLPILFMYDTTLTMIVLGIGALMAITIALSLRPLRQRVMQAYTYDAGFQSTLIETLKGMKTIKSLANESFFVSALTTP